MHYNTLLLQVKQEYLEWLSECWLSTVRVAELVWKQVQTVGPATENARRQRKSTHKLLSMQQQQQRPFSGHYSIYSSTCVSWQLQLRTGESFWRGNMLMSICFTGGNCSVLFCSSAILSPRFGHTMNVISLFISVLCHSDWLFHGESCPILMSIQAVRGLRRLRALFLALVLSPGNSLVSPYYDHSMLASLLWQSLIV